jgi:hypothetical protein|tara:strand:+ start:4102 stop:4407 length:306 start_codon:yes stop_codon:yes gene_type:complete
MVGNRRLASNEDQHHNTITRVFLSHHLSSRELTTSVGSRNRLILFAFFFLFLSKLGRGIFFGGGTLFDVFLLGWLIFLGSILLAFAIGALLFEVLLSAPVV